MRAERSITEQSSPDIRDVYKVAQWKWGIDEGSPWWKRFYFKYIFLTFLSWSFQLGIPTPKEVEVTSDEHGRVKRVFRWWEDEGIFECEEQADAGCLEQHWGYVKLPLGRLMPPDSAQYAGTVFPRKKDPKKALQWAKPKSTFVIKDRAKEEREQQEWQECLRRLNQALD